ncbi:MAG TPA: hypothetical protein VHA12_04480 [Candidatus Nanoarchaeia archaeon]|nr:hypothetical protein [Candidatus Nanoarchaeia archaeon]
MNNFKEILFIYKEIFKEWKYPFIVLATSFIFYIISSILFQFQYVSLESLKNLEILLLAFYTFSSTTIFTSTIIIALLTGILISLLTYRFDNIKKYSEERIGIISSIGIFFGLAAPGCASCGAGLAAALGLGTILAKLPFHGIEISFIAIILLIFSIYKISKGFVNCEIKN